MSDSDYDDYVRPSVGTIDECIRKMNNIHKCAYSAYSKQRTSWENSSILQKRKYEQLAGDFELIKKAEKEKREAKAAANSKKALEMEKELEDFKLAETAKNDGKINQFRKELEAATNKAVQALTSKIEKLKNIAPTTEEVDFDEKCEQFAKSETGFLRYMDKCSDAINSVPEPKQM